MTNQTNEELRDLLTRNSSIEEIIQGDEWRQFELNRMAARLNIYVNKAISDVLDNLEISIKNQIQVRTDDEKWDNLSKYKQRKIIERYCVATRCRAIIQQERNKLKEVSSE